MRRGGHILLPLLLAGCAHFSGPAIQTLGAPGDPKQFALDDRFCTASAAAWKPSAAPGDIIQGAVDGGAGTFSYVILNPAVPIAGAIGGAGDQLEHGFDVTGRSRRNVYRHCMEDVTAKDGSALIARPDN